MSNEIPKAAKIGATVAITAGAILAYNRYQTVNKPKTNEKITDQKLIDKLTQSAKNYPDSNTEYKGIYLYSKKSNKVYLRAKDGNIYRAGNLSDCQYLMDEKSSATAYEISDIYNVFSCNSSSNPPEYLDKINKICSSSNPPSGSARIKINTAEDFEKNLEKIAIGDTVVSQDICFPPSSIDGGDSLGPFGRMYKNFAEFCKENSTKFVELVGQFGLFVAVAQFNMMFAIAIFVFPGVFSTDSWESTKSGFTTLQIFGEWMLESIILESSKVALAFQKSGTKALINESDGLISRVCNRMAISISRRMSSRAITLFVNVMKVATKAFNILGFLQIGLMIIDTFDFCKVMTMNNNLTQSIMDMQQKISNEEFKMMSGYNILYPNIWDPKSNYCDYDIDPRTCPIKFKDCTKQIFKTGQKWGDGKKYLQITSTDKNEIDEDSYCDDINKKYQTYQNDYISKLKVNSLGQCITELSNKEIAETLRLYVGDKLPNVDFDSIAGINKNNYPDDLFPKDDFAKQFSIFLVNQNSFAAQFVKDNIYYFLSIFIIILIIILVV